MRPRTHIRTLYIGGLPPATTAEALRSVFERFGAIEDVRILRRREADIAYITFVDESAAHRARDALDGSQVAGQRVRVEFAT